MWNGKLSLRVRLERRVTDRILSRTGEWIGVTPKKFALVINVGQVIERELS